MGPASPVLQTLRPPPLSGLGFGSEKRAIFSVLSSGTFAAGIDCSRSSRARMTRRERKQRREFHIMLGWVVTFLIIALIAGVLGFGGVAGASIEIAKIIFVIALVLFLVSAIFGIVRGRRI
jgi:uncharacterized membrane protein YtjA (UPF0391 family)